MLFPRNQAWDWPRPIVAGACTHEILYTLVVGLTPVPLWIVMFAVAAICCMLVEAARLPEAYLAAVDEAYNATATLS